MAHEAPRWSPILRPLPRFARACGRGAGPWLGGLAILTLASWGRWLATGSPKVDENYPAALAGTLLFAALLVGWALLVVGWRSLLDQPPENPRRLAYAGLTIAALMLPMFSNDAFSVFAYGSLAAHGRDVYTTARFLPESAWYPWIGERWSDKVAVYGPLTLALSEPVAIAKSNPWAALVVVRLLWFVPLAIVMELSFRKMACRPFFHAMVWLNPLFVVEGPGQLHADLLGVVAVIAGVLLYEEGRFKAGGALFAAAVLSKVSFALTGVWFWLAGAPTIRGRLVRLLGMGGTLAGFAMVAYAPFWRGPATIASPLRALAGMNPGGSLTEVAGYVVHVLRGGAIPDAASGVRESVDFEQATKASTWFVASLVLRGAALVLGARVIVAVLRKPSDRDALALGTGTLLVLFVTIASHRFQSWYLLAALPFFGLRCTDEWRRFWLAVVSVSVAQQFVAVLPRTSALLPIWSVTTTALLMAVFLWSFRSRYLTLAWAARVPVPPSAGAAPRGTRAPAAP